MQTKRVRVIASKPKNGQDSIISLIGREFQVASINKDEDGKPDGTINVISDKHGGQITLQKNEFVFC